MSGFFLVKDGKAAIWTGADDAPFTNPLGNLARVKFHSDLDYMKIVVTLSKTVTLPAIPKTGSGQGDAGSRTATYNLGPHGQGRVPFVLAKIVVNGVPVAFTGSVCVHQNPYNGNAYVGSGARWLSLGCDAVNVYAQEYAMQSGFATDHWETRPAQTFAITLYITDVTL